MNEMGCVTGFSELERRSVVSEQGQISSNGRKVSLTQSGACGDADSGNVNGCILVMR